MAKSPDKPTGSDGDSQPEDGRDLAEAIKEQIGPLISKNQRDQIVQRVVQITQSERFQGPIAHPRHLREYEEIQPGAADRIIQMAEADQKHSQELQSLALNADIQDTREGRLYGFVALIILILASLGSGYLGMQALSLSFLGAGVLGIVGALIKGRNND